MAPSIEIASFLRAATENENAIVENHKELLALLGRLDAAFRGLAGEMFADPPLAFLLLLNAHASYLSAVRIALSGQSPPTFMALRGCVESALYALIAGSDDSNATAWYERDRDRKRSRRIFTAQNGLKILKVLDPNLERFLREHYDWSIELGAHPNKLSLILHLEFGKVVESGQRVSLVYLHGPTSTAVVQALAACVEVGIATVSLSPHVIPNHSAARSAHREAWSVYDAYIPFLREHGHQEALARAHSIFDSAESRSPQSPSGHAHRAARARSFDQKSALRR